MDTGTLSTTALSNLLHAVESANSKKKTYNLSSKLQTLTQKELFKKERKLWLKCDYYQEKIYLY